MCEPTTIAMAVMATAAVAGTAATVYNGQKQQSTMKEATQQAKVASDKQTTIAEQAANKANAKTPDISAARAGNQTGENAGGTLLTGPAGVDPSKLLLGKNTLLGM